MKMILISALEAKAKRVGDQYLADVREAATSWGPRTCTISDEDAARIGGKYVELERKGFLQTVRLGDKIERATRALGIKPCKGCRKRKKILNGE